MVVATYESGIDVETDPIRNNCATLHCATTRHLDYVHPPPNPQSVGIGCKSSSRQKESFSSPGSNHYTSSVEQQRQELQSLKTVPEETVLFNQKQDFDNFWKFMLLYHLVPGENLFSAFQDAVWSLI
ncbi:hypothetical protein NPIL_578771 [Nephila pilipes]|uniref:Uncharacterized protein n=1 Tax=Nephila pilipes TaxID=299642 RepID=A0A8X6QC82_NEPPI|nr:hypothetical protein NPIL_578771 [Nephila pilipes]